MLAATEVLNLLPEAFDRSLSSPASHRQVKFPSFIFRSRPLDTCIGTDPLFFLASMATDGNAGDSGAVGGVAADTVRFRCSNGTKFSVQTELDFTVGRFKAALGEKRDVPVER